MRIATLVVVQCVVLTGCVGEASSDSTVTPQAMPVSSGSGQALTGVPFVPAFSGHHLAVLSDVAIVADPEGSTDDGQHPQIFLVSLTSREIIATLALPAGANPQAVVVASDNNVYVVATGLGGIYPIDVAHHALGAFSAVCEAPVDAAANGPNLVVACLSGELVTMTAQGVSFQAMGTGLARVAVDSAGHVFVATQSAQVIQVDTMATITPASVALPAISKRTAVANTPRRLIPLPGGGIAMLYQQSLSGELTDPGSTDPTDPSDPPPSPPDQNGNAYTGGSGMCSVPATRPVVTEVLPSGVLGTQRWVLGTLPIDAAASPDGAVIAFADASGGNVLLSRLVDLANGAPDDTCFANTGITNPGGLDTGVTPTPSAVTLGAPIAVAFYGSTLVVLNAKNTLELATLSIDGTGSQSEIGGRMALRSRSPSDGFTLFHQDPTLFGNGQTPPVPSPLSGFTHSAVACASCHPDGLTTGATTTLLGVTHRVMPLANHLKNAPLVHWDGLPFHDAVVTHTWEQNMGGTPLSLDQEAALRSYVDQLQMPARPAISADAAAAGATLFAKAGCDTCHLPASGFTNGSTANVGRGMHKVPSLVGVAYTAPYMSDGCAPTLEARFDDAACGGGARHGNVAALTADERAALIVYLKSL